MNQIEEKGKLFVGGLSWETTQASLLTYFSRYGEVSDCVVILNTSTGKSRGFGFVTFKDPACVETVQAAGPHILDGKQIDPNGCNRKKLPKTAKGTENSRKKLFVGGLPANIEENQLREAFNKYGKINEVVIVYDQQKQKPRGFGFLTFDTEESVDKIVRERFVMLNGKQVECKRAEARDLQLQQQQLLQQQLMESHPGGLVMLAHGPDGTIGLVQAQPSAAGQALVYPSGLGGALNGAGSLMTPAELAGAYRGLMPGMISSRGAIEGPMQHSSGLRYIAHPNGAVGSQQYVMLAQAPTPSGNIASASANNGLNNYLLQQHQQSLGVGGSVGSLLVHHPGGGLSALGGLLSMNSAQANGVAGGGVIVAGPNGMSYLLQTPNGLGGGNPNPHQNVGNSSGGSYLVTGPGGATYLVQGAGSGGQVILQGSGMMQQNNGVSAGGLTLVQGAGPLGSSGGGGVYIQGGNAGTQYLLGPNGEITAVAGNLPTSLAGAYGLQLAAGGHHHRGGLGAIGLVNGAGDGQGMGLEEGQIRASNSDSLHTPGASQNHNHQHHLSHHANSGQGSLNSSTSKVGYYLLPGYGPTSMDQPQATILAAASPQLAAYGRIASGQNIALSAQAQGYHPYRR